MAEVIQIEEPHTNNDPTESGKISLPAAICSDNMKPIKYHFGFNWYFFPMKNVKTKLHYLAKNGTAAEICEILRHNDTDVNARDKYGRTPLHLACRNFEEKAIVVILLEHGADINSRDNSGRSPLEYAAALGSLEIVKILVNLSADIEQRNQIHGRRVLHTAAKHGWPDIVELLLDHGADINVICRNQRTPLAYALEHKFNNHALRNRAMFHYECDYYHRKFVTIDFRINRVIEILKRHIIKIKALNMYVSKSNLLDASDIEYDNDFKRFYVNCKLQIETMKNLKINDTNVYFYDMMTKGIGQLAAYSRNEIITNVMRTIRDKHDFDIYKIMMYDNFRKGQKRQILLNNSKKSIELMSRYALPDLVIDQLLSHLSNNDLDSVIKAGKIN